MQITDAMVEAGWQAYQNTPIDLLADSDEETKRCVVNALTAALAKAWRPIESAPRDQAILLFGAGTFHGAPFCGYWDDINLFPDRPWVAAIIQSRLYEHAVTHWMPIPAPPATKEAGER